MDEEGEQEQDEEEERDEWGQLLKQRVGREREREWRLVIAREADNADQGRVVTFSLAGWGEQAGWHHTWTDTLGLRLRGTKRRNLQKHSESSKRRSEMERNDTHNGGQF